MQFLNEDGNVFSALSLPHDFCFCQWQILIYYFFPICLSFFIYPLAHARLQFCSHPCNSGCIAVYDDDELNVARRNSNVFVFLCPPQPFFLSCRVFFNCSLQVKARNASSLPPGDWFLIKRSSWEKTSLLLEMVQFQEGWNPFKNASGCIFGVLASQGIRLPACHHNPAGCFTVSLSLSLQLAGVWVCKGSVMGVCLRT